MSLVEIVTLDERGSDIHATLAFINPLVGLRHQGAAIYIITCVATPHKGLYCTVNYVWHLTERMTTNARPFKHSTPGIRR